MDRPSSTTISNNLKYPKIKDYDGVFLNSIVGEFAADPAVRDGLARFVREGGGMGGIHGTPWASRNWDEFAEMIGSQSAPHRIEQGVMKVYDPASPIMKPFDGKDLNFREEYYRFEHEGQGRLRWDKVRVLMTVELDDPKIEPQTVDRLQASGQHLSRDLDPHLRQGTRLLLLARPHAGDVHDRRSSATSWPACSSCWAISRRMPRRIRCMQQADEAHDRHLVFLAAWPQTMDADQGTSVKQGARSAASALRAGRSAAGTIRLFSSITTVEQWEQRRAADESRARRRCSGTTCAGPIRLRPQP